MWEYIIWRENYREVVLIVAVALVEVAVVGGLREGRVRLAAVVGVLVGMREASGIRSARRYGDGGEGGGGEGLGDGGRPGCC